MAASMREIGRNVALFVLANHGHLNANIGVEHTVFYNQGLA